MSEQGGDPSTSLRTGLAKLREKIRTYALATSNVYWEPEEWTDLPEYGDLAAELAAVEARLEKFKRFVRAWDAEQATDIDDEDAGEAAYSELQATRAAITAEDLAERG